MADASGSGQASGQGSTKGPRQQAVQCFEGRGGTLEEAVQNAVTLADTSNAVVYDLHLKVLVGNPITDYIVQLSPPGS